MSHSPWGLGPTKAIALTEIKRFMIELGAGFAFVGREVPLNVDGEELRR